MRLVVSGRRTALALAAALALAGCSSYHNLHDYQQELVAYHDQGPYQADVRAVADRAAAWVTERAKMSGRLALVLDIDETSLSDWQELRTVSFGYEPAHFKGWVHRQDAPPLVPVRDLFFTAQKTGVSVFFITARPEELRADTEGNLRKAGYTGWAGIFFKPKGFHAPPGASSATAAYKTSCRQTIASEGYLIIANVGDQESDLVGGYAERTFKLPNPFYYIP